MSVAAAQTPTAQNIILFEHKQLMQDIAGFLAISLFVTAVLLWAY
jgi:hypothetical protein